MADDLLVARGLVVAYGKPAAMFARRSVAPAVLYGIDIHVGKGETVGIVGESGSGKTTLGRALLGLVKPVAGSVIFDGRDITALDEKARRPLRRRMQMIFQDPMSSLNPRHTIGRILTEPVLLHGLAQERAHLCRSPCHCACGLMTATGDTGGRHFIQQAFRGFAQANEPRYRRALRPNN